MAEKRIECDTPWRAVYTDHLRREYGPLRKWRALKRGQVRKAIAAVDDLSLGCAFTPAYRKIVEARNALNEARRLMSVKEWGQ